MTIAALPDSIVELWWGTLLLGLVIAATVVVLLHVLLNTTKKIDANVKELWATATTVARNTATTWLLGDTANALEEIKAEALRHDALLSGADE